jgi:hypothetical protein
LFDDRRRWKTDDDDELMMMMVMIMVGNFWSPLRVLMTVSLKTFWRAEMF